MGNRLPELAVDDDFSSEAYEPDEDGVYLVVEYRRKNGTLYLKSKLSHRVARGQYKFVTLSYYDLTGNVRLHDVVWELGYDVNKKIVSKKVSP